MPRDSEDPRHGLPDFDHPPVTELVLGVQFEPLAGLLAPQIGLFWAEVRDRFPNVQQQPALEPVIERFGVKQTIVPVGFKVMDTAETPRCWFLDASGNQLIQVQQDRLIYNWRKQADSDAYPRYETIKAAFLAELERFVTFVGREALGTLKPNQCEITYINHVRPSGVWNDFGQADRIFRVWAPPRTDAPLPAPEDVRFNVRFLLSEAEKLKGRLHVSAQPAYLRKDGSDIFAMNLTARGAPEGEGMSGVIRFLDRGHRAIVLAFDALTTEAMHRVWGKKYGT